VNQILVEGAVRTDPAAIHAAIALNKGDSLVGYDVKAARKRLEDLPWVKLASVERRLPSTLKVQVYEHQAFARLAEGGETWVVDKEASRIVPADGGFAELPLLSGVGVGGKAAGLFAMLAARPALLSILVAATYVGERRWDLTFQGDILVNLPETNPDRALELLITLDAQRQVLTVKEAQIDLRLPDRITLKLPEHIPVESLFPAGTKRDIVKP
jgi:cell division protein FtsQ